MSPAYLDREAHQKRSVVQFAETPHDLFPELLAHDTESVCCIAPVFSSIYTQVPLPVSNSFLRKRGKRLDSLLVLPDRTRFVAQARVLPAAAGPAPTLRPLLHRPAPHPTLWPPPLLHPPAPLPLHPLAHPLEDPNSPASSGVLLPASSHRLLPNKLHLPSKHLLLSLVVLPNEISKSRPPWNTVFWGFSSRSLQCCCTRH